MVTCLLSVERRCLFYCGVFSRTLNISLLENEKDSISGSPSPVYVFVLLRRFYKGLYLGFNDIIVFGKTQVRLSE
jgi:hypothetical protein